MPVIFHSIRSPPSRAVLLVAKAIGVNLESRLVNTAKGDHMTPEFLKMNPLHTIPVLDDNGTVVFDSHAINTYLFGKYGKPEHDSFYPKDLALRANVDARLHFDTTLFTRVRCIYEPVLYDNSPELSLEKIQYVQRCWPLLEGFLANNKYLCGDKLTLADFSCAATVTSVNTIAIIDPKLYPNLTAWLNRMKELPYFGSINAVGASEIQTTVINRAKENAQK